MYISYDGMTDPLGQSQVLPYLCGLQEAGYQMHILSAEKRENFSRSEATVRKIMDEAGIIWHYRFYRKSPPVLSTLRDLYDLRKMALNLHQEHQFCLIHCRSYIAALIGQHFWRKLQVPFVFDMRGFWADERVDGGIWNLKNPLFRRIYSYFKGKEKEFLQESAYTVSLTENARQEIRTWQLPELSPIQVIPCCVDTHLFDPEKIESSPQKPFTVSYLGSIGTWYMLDEMLIFFKKLLEEKPEAHFLFITRENPEAIRNRAVHFGIAPERLEITPAERKQVPVLLSRSHLSVFFIKPYFSKKASSATKMGEILALGIPILCNRGVGDQEYLYEKFAYGAMVDFSSPESPADTGKLFEPIVKNVDQLRAIDPENLRALAMDYFGLEKGIQRYREIYAEVI